MYSGPQNSVVLNNQAIYVNILWDIRNTNTLCFTR